MGKRISTFVPRGGGARQGKKQGHRSKDVYKTALHFLLARFPNRKLEWPFQGTRIIGVFCLCVYLCFTSTSSLLIYPHCSQDIVLLH